MTNEEMKDSFLQWVGNNWDVQVEKLRKFCSNKRLIFDDDILSDTILKVSEKILKHGIDDATNSGFDKYLFKSFKLNILREAQYSRNARRDYNIENLNDLYEEYCNANFTTAQDKLISDLRKDFSAIFVLSKVEEKFGSEMSRLFCEKYYLSRTYKELQKIHPDRKKLRDTLLDMKRWAMENLTREEIDAAFNEEYSDILE